MPEKIDLGQGHQVEIRDLTGRDRKEYLVFIEGLRKDKGPAVLHEPDPDNPAVMREIPNPEAQFGVTDNYALIDHVAAKVIASWTLPGDMPYTPAHREHIPLELDEKFNEVVDKIAVRLTGGGPKEETNDTSSTTSSGDAPALPTEPTPEP